jgi:lycopene beta-cyclase
MDAPLNPQNQYDLIFLGMGAANALLAIKLFEGGAFSGKRVAYIDPRIQDKDTFHSDQTFCFWATEAEMQEMGLAHLVSASWNQVRVNGIHTPIAPYRYYHIRSEDLFRFTGEVLERHGAHHIGESARNLDLKSYPHRITTDSGKTYTANDIFDSRPPEFLECQAHQTHLHQSFYGWVVEALEPVFDAATFTMMDFNVPQMGATQFMYVLPFGERTALVELTRFGPEIIQKDEAEAGLKHYIEEHFGPVQIIRDEYGVIPMSSAALPDTYMGRHALRTGSRAGRIKPSTGYAFKEMCYDAMRIAENAHKGYYWGFHRAEAHKRGRFAFYDRLLLQVLNRWPEQGAPLFSALFAHIKAPRVLQFLEEKTQLTQEVPILMSLPKKPFLQAAVRDFKNQLQGRVKTHISVVLALLVALLYGIQLEQAAQGLLLLGLMVVGIPHGALDHVLESKGTKANFSFAFFAKYLGLMGLMLAIWLVYAPLGLVLFLLYSAWHFGESDFKEMGLKASVFSFSWGIYLLGTLLITHLTELNVFLPFFGVSAIGDSVAILGIPAGDWVLGILGLLLMIFSYLYPLYSGLRKVVYILIIGYFLPLLVAFGLYFVGHHSLNGWKHLREGLQYSNRNLWKTAWPFSLGAFALIGGFLALSEPGVTAYWAQFFVFLSCVSFPHVWEMRKFYAAA